MNIYTILFAVIAMITSFILGYALIPVILNFCKRNSLYDMPDARKVHKNKIPRLGGVVFVPCVFLGCIIASVVALYNGMTTLTLSLWTVYFGISISIIYLTGLIDDVIGLKASTKLVIQLLAACALSCSGLYINNLYGFCGIYEIPYYAGFLLTVFVVAFISNAINLIDGIDGLASGLTIIALVGFICAFAYWGLEVYVIIISALIGVLAAYSYYNIFGNADKNRKIFMGDTGSLSIGFLLAFLSLKLSMINPNLKQFDGNGLLISYTLLIVPVFDVFRVAIVRMMHRRSPVAPDKNHIHHKMMRAGLSQHKALGCILCTALFFIIVNVLCCFVSLQITYIVILDIVLYITLNHFIDRLIIKKGRETFV